MQIITFHVIFINVFSNSIPSILMATTEGPVAKLKMSNYSISSTVSCLSFISYSIYFLTSSSWVHSSTKLSAIIPMWIFFLESIPRCKTHYHKLILVTDCLYASDIIKHRENMKSMIFSGFFFTIKDKTALMCKNITARKLPHYFPVRK